MINQKIQTINFMKLNKKITKDKQNTLYLQNQPFFGMAQSLCLSKKYLIPAILKRKIKIKTQFQLSMLCF